MLKEFLIFQEMGLSGFNTFLKISYIFSKESFSYILGNRTFLHFRKQKLKKNSLYFKKCNFLNL